MSDVRLFPAGRGLLGLGLLGTAIWTAGCGGDVNTQTPAPAQSQADQDAERAKREEALGKRGIQKPAEHNDKGSRPSGGSKPG